MTSELLRAATRGISALGRAKRAGGWSAGRSLAAGVQVFLGNGVYSIVTLYLPVSFVILGAL